MFQLKPLKQICGFVLHLFRGHVSDGADDLPPNRNRAGKSWRIGSGNALDMQVLGQPKIQQLGITSAGYKNVRWLKVAMNNGPFVRRFESIGGLQSQIETRFQRQRMSSDLSLKRLALQQFHGDEILAVLFS